MSRLETVKNKLKERRKFHDALRKAERLKHLESQIQKIKNRDTWLATFNFSPSEVGIDIAADKDSISELGEIRATHRLNHMDFYTQVSVRVKGEYSPEIWTSTREKVRLQQLEAIKQLASPLTLDLPDLSGLTTAGTE